MAIQTQRIFEATPADAQGSILVDITYNDTGLPSPTAASIIITNNTGGPVSGTITDTASGRSVTGAVSGTTRTLNVAAASIVGTLVHKLAGDKVVWPLQITVG